MADDLRALQQRLVGMAYERRDTELARLADELGAALAVGPDEKQARQVENLKMALAGFTARKAPLLAKFDLHGPPDFASWLRAHLAVCEELVRR